MSSKTKEELAERGQDVFERVVRPRVEDEDDHMYVAIDVESEDFEVDRNGRAAYDRLVERHPDAQGRIWLRRVGSRFAYHFGGRLQDAPDEP